jgi:hypothetical protein
MSNMPKVKPTGIKWPRPGRERIMIKLSETGEWVDVTDAFQPGSVRPGSQDTIVS